MFYLFYIDLTWMWKASASSLSSKSFKGEDIPMPTTTFYNRQTHDTELPPPPHSISSSSSLFLVRNWWSQNLFFSLLGLHFLRLTSGSRSHDPKNLTQFLFFFSPLKISRNLMHAPTTLTFSTRPSVPVWLWQSPKANPQSSRRDGRRRPEIFFKNFLAGTQQAGRSFARAVERSSRTFTLHAGARWPLNRAPATSWAILFIRSQGKLLSVCGFKGGFIVDTILPLLYVMT
jgi:hypothetical protein